MTNNKRYLFALLGVFGLTATYALYKYMRNRPKRVEDDQTKHDKIDKNSVPPEPEKESRSSLCEKGNKCFHYHQYDEAIKIYSQAINEYPTEDNKTIFYNRAASYYSIKKYNECINDLNQVINYDKKHFKSYYKKGLCYEAMGEYLECLVNLSVAFHIGQTTEIGTKFTEVLNNYLKIRIADEETKKEKSSKTELPSSSSLDELFNYWYKPLHQKVTKSLDELNDAISLSSDSSSYYRRAVYYLSNYLYDEAEKDFQIAVDYGDFENEYEAKLEIAIFLSCRGLHQESLQKINEIIDNPKYKITYHAYLRKASVMAILKMDASDLFDMLYQKYGNEIDILYHHGQYLSFVKQFEKAFEYMNKVISIESNWSSPYLSKAMCLHEMGDVNEAKAQIEMSLDKKPCTPIMIFFYCSVLLSLSLVEEAEQALAKGQKMDSNCAYFKIIECQIVSFKTNNSQKCIDIINEGLQLDNKLVLLYQMKATYERELENPPFSDMIAYLQRAIDLTDHQEEFQGLLGLLIDCEIRKISLPIIKRL